MADVTLRCQHCGGTRKEHHKRAPFRCPTRLTESYWKPWTLEAYKQAERAAKNRVTSSSRLEDK